MTDYEMSTSKDWDTTLKLFSNLFMQKRKYHDDQANHSGFESAANITNRAAPITVRSIPMAMGRSAGSIAGRSLAGSSVAPVTHEGWMGNNGYIDGPHESVAEAKGSAAKVSTTSGHSKLMDDT